MLKHNLRRMREADDRGFTLIELMVVVLIMGILMAIAIPTFLSTKNSANDSSAQSNATNAVTNLKSYYAANQTFTNVTSSLDNQLPWGTGQGQVNVVVGDDAAAKTPGTWTVSAGTSGSAFELTSTSKSGACYWVFDDEGATPATIGYQFQPSTAKAACGTFPALPSGTIGTSGAIKTAGNWESNW